MVESEAKELDEDIMLGAVMFGHRGFQPVIDAIIKLAEVAAKEPRDFQPDDHSALEAEMLKVAEAELRDAYKNTEKADRYAAVDAVKAKVKAHFFPEGVEEPEFSAEEIATVFKSSAGEDRSLEHSRHQEPYRRPRSVDRSPDRFGSRHSAAHPRFGPVHPR